MDTPERRGATEPRECLRLRPQLPPGRHAAVPLRLWRIEPPRPEGERCTVRRLRLRVLVALRGDREGHDRVALRLRIRQVLRVLAVARRRSSMEAENVRQMELRRG